MTFGSQKGGYLSSLCAICGFLLFSYYITAFAMEIPPQDVNQDEVWEEVDALDNDTTTHTSPYYEHRVRLRDLLKEKVDSALALDRGLSKKKKNRSILLSYWGLKRPMSS